MGYPLSAMPRRRVDLLQVQKDCKAGIRESITRYIEGTLYLKVNKEKTTVSYVRGMKCLGYSLCNEGSMSTHGTSEIQGQDEIKT